MLTNCVNCGAPLEGLKCEYCGTIHENTDVEVLYYDNKIIDVVSENGIKQD